MLLRVMFVRFLRCVCVFGYMLQEVWSCWIELLQYLDMENSWVNTLEEKVKATDNLPESTEAVSEALEVQIPAHTHTSTHFMNLSISTPPFSLVCCEFS